MRLDARRVSIDRLRDGQIHAPGNSLSLHRSSEALRAPKPANSGNKTTTCNSHCVPTGEGKCIYAAASQVRF